MILYGKECILRKATEYRKVELVYFLIDDEEIVYIGHTTNLGLRLAFHKAEKKFDKVATIIDRGVDMGELEGAYILKFAPKYNGLKCKKMSSKYRPKKKSTKP